MLIGMTITMAALGAVVSTFLIQSDHYDRQDKVVEMQETARGGLQIMAADLMMAGYDPTNMSGVGIDSASASAIQMSADFNGDGSLGTDETVSFAHDATSGQLTRNGTVLADHIESLTFTYYDAANTVTTAPGSIRKIKIDLTVESRDGKMNRTLTTDVIPRNLALSPPPATGTTATETSTTTTTTTTSSTSSTSSSSSTDTTASSTSSTSSSTSSSSTSSTVDASTTTSSSTEGATTTTTVPDAMGPDIALIDPPSGTEDKNVPIQVRATVVDDTGVATVVINWTRYKSNGDLEASGTVGMTAAGNTYSGSIPSAGNNDTVEYSVTAVDTLGNESFSDGYSYQAG